MSSRERMLAAMRREPADHVPCSIYFNEHLRVDGYDMLQWREHIRLQEDLGTDPIVYVVIPGSYHPSVETRVWLEDAGSGGDGGKAAASGSGSGRGPVLYKEYRTPAGTLRMGVRTAGGWPPRHEGIPGGNWDLLRHAADYSPDWRRPLDLPWDDHAASNIVEPLIKSADDLEAFEHIWRPPGESDMPDLDEYNTAALETARQEGLAVQGYAGAGLATLMFTMGAEAMVMLSVDQPEVFRSLAEIDHRTNLGRIRMCARAGADIVKRFGGYEQTNLLHPRVFREVLAPLLRKEVEAAHEEGLLIYYRVVTGMEPLLEDIAAIGFDCIQGGEPHLSRCSFETWRDAFSGRASSWTGVSTPVLLVSGTEQEVRAEVRRCLDVLGPQGLILGVTNSIRSNCRWENVLVMVDEWKRAAYNG